ncbi:MAG: hydrogen gas-evolving membrane-bound hydrogenase subunit E, partial [Desulfotignum sp.]
VATFLQRLWITTPGLYQRTLDDFLAFAGGFTKKIQNGSLHFYLFVTIFTMVAAVGWPWIFHIPAALVLPETVGPSIALGLFAFILASTGVVVTARKRLSAIGGLAGVGSGVALTFLVFGAPDIALTQLLVETLTVIFVSLVLLRLPPMDTVPKRSYSRTIGDACLSLGAGLVLTTVLMGVLQVPLDRSLTAFFENHAYIAAHGRNIVNVILVDFRCLDTLGEICVVVLAAWAAVTLIRRPKEG